MKQQKKKTEYHEHDTPMEEFPDISNAASANECTGLMYRTPADGAEWESFQQLSPMGIPKSGEEMDGTVLEKLRHAETPEEAGKAVEEASGEYSLEYKPRHLKEK